MFLNQTTLTFRCSNVLFRKVCLAPYRNRERRIDFSTVFSSGADGGPAGGPFDLSPLRPGSACRRVNNTRKHKEFQRHDQRSLSRQPACPERGVRPRPGPTNTPLSAPPPDFYAPLTLFSLPAPAGRPLPPAHRPSPPTGVPRPQSPPLQSPQGPLRRTAHSGPAPGGPQLCTPPPARRYAAG